MRLSEKTLEQIEKIDLKDAYNLLLTLSLEHKQLEQEVEKVKKGIKTEFHLAYLIEPTWQQDLIKRGEHVTILNKQRQRISMGDYFDEKQLRLAYIKKFIIANMEDEDILKARI